MVPTRFLKLREKVHFKGCDLVGCGKRPCDSLAETRTKH
jgi:hypothetical protein